MRLRPLVLAWFALGAPIAAAPRPDPPPAAAPSPPVATALAAPSGLAELAFLVGDWDVVVTTPGEAGAATVRYEVRPFSGALWLSGHGVSRELGIDARDVWGRDPATGELTRAIYDSGGTLGLLRSPGWRSDGLVLDGEARSAGGTIRVRQTIRRSGADRFSVTWDAWRDGGWRSYSLEEARRRS